MFLKLRKIWKQRRELKRGMGAEAIPIIATPSMNHRSLATNTQDALSTNVDDNVFESSSSDNCLRYSARLKVNIPESIHFHCYYFQKLTISKGICKTYFRGSLNHIKNKIEYTNNK